MIDKAKEVIEVSRSEWLERHCHQKGLQANAGPTTSLLERILAQAPKYAPLESFADATYGKPIAS